MADRRDTWWSGAVSVDVRQLSRTLRTGRLDGMPWLQPPEPVEPLEAGEVVAGRFRLGAVAGRGGFGVVHEGVDLRSGDRVAIKRLVSADPHQVRSMEAEAAMLRVLPLPGVVGFLADGEHGGQRWVAMPWVEGAPFPGPLGRSWEAVGPTWVAVVEAVARVHQLGLLHRDLKPSNVLVDAAGRPTVLDFGLALHDTLSARFEGSGRLIGTPAYLAPEQFLGAGATPRSDAYALGVMLFEALAGALPLDADDLSGLILRRVEEDVPDIRSVVADVPEGVATLLQRLLSREPGDRPATLGELLPRVRELLPDGDGRAMLGPSATALEHRLGAGPWTPSQMAGLVAVETVFDHEDEDAGVWLHTTTGGVPRRVAGVVGAWVRAQVARWESGRLSFGTDGLSGALATVPLDPARDGEPPEALDSDLRELAAWLSIAGPGVPILTVVEAADGGADGAGPALQRLVSLGVVVVRDGMVVAVHVPVRAPKGLDASAARRRLLAVVPPDAPGALALAFAAGDLHAAQRASEASAHRHLASSDASLGWTWGRATHELARRAGSGSSLAAMAEAALMLSSSSRIEEVLRVAERGDEEGIATLMLAARRVLAGEELGEGPLPMPSMPNASLEAWWFGIHLWAVRRRAPEDTDAILADIEAFADLQLPDHPLHARLLGWRAQAQWRRYDFLGCAQTRIRAFHRDPGPTRASLANNAALAFLEAGSFAEVDHWTSVASELLRERRNPLVESVVAYVRRSSQYRQDVALDAEPGLHEAAVRDAYPASWAHLAVTDAAFAWRCGDLGRAASLARDAAGTYRTLGSRPAEALAVALAAVAGCLPSADVAAKTLQTLQGTGEPLVTIQARYLWRMAGLGGPEPGPAPPGVDASLRREVLALDGS